MNTLLRPKENMHPTAKIIEIPVIPLHEIQGMAMSTLRPLLLDEIMGVLRLLREIIMPLLRDLLVIMMTSDLVVLLGVTTKTLLLVTLPVAMKLLAMNVEAEDRLPQRVGIIPTRLRIPDHGLLQAVHRSAAVKSMSDHLIGIIVLKWHFTLFTELPTFQGIHDATCC